jgi:hypothetical protein
MKKLRNFFLVFSFIFLLTVSNLFASSYEIETSRGPRIVEIPEGYTELEAFLEMSKLYLEERFDHEDLLNVVDDLKSNYTKVKQEKSDLDDLYKDAIKDRDDLSDLLSKKSKPKFVSPSVGISGLTNYTFSVDVGIVLLEKIQVSTILSGNPLAIGLRIGVIF